MVKYLCQFRLLSRSLIHRWEWYNIPESPENLPVGLNILKISQNWWKFRIWVFPDVLNTLFSGGMPHNLYISTRRRVAVLMDDGDMEISYCGVRWRCWTLCWSDYRSSYIHWLVVICKAVVRRKGDCPLPSRLWGWGWHRIEYQNWLRLEWRGHGCAPAMTHWMFIKRYYSWSPL